MTMEKDLVKAWKGEEETAYIHGWDFSHIDGRCIEEALPWDYREIIAGYLTPDMKLLDIDTGGGEFTRYLCLIGKIANGKATLGH